MRKNRSGLPDRRNVISSSSSWLEYGIEGHIGAGAVAAAVGFGGDGVGG